VPEPAIVYTKKLATADAVCRAGNVLSVLLHDLDHSRIGNRYIVLPSN